MNTVSIGYYLRMASPSLSMRLGEAFICGQHLLRCMSSWGQRTCQQLPKAPISLSVHRNIINTSLGSKVTRPQQLSKVCFFM